MDLVKLRFSVMDVAKVDVLAHIGRQIFRYFRVRLVLILALMVIDCQDRWVRNVIKSVFRR